MFSSEFLPLLKSYLPLCHVLKCIPFDYNKDSGRLETFRSAGKRSIFKLQCTLSAFYCMAMFLNLCFGPLSATEKFQGSAFFFLYLISTVARWAPDNAPIQVVNSFLEFEHRFLSGHYHHE
ncbi:hypothetical protein Fcan01_01404 [Folsomia candida]|uniref:Uncharacterized protein n=1 Tax=Folsomia candida TaxID=158441 RepID=A0A226F3D2_FOLCA|nr:hypothetical protein Fcan01_01404 [Folsomia candida]